jgi:hypothetical protein
MTPAIGDAGVELPGYSGDVSGHHDWEHVDLWIFDEKQSGSF